MISAVKRRRPQHLAARSHAAACGEYEPSDIALALPLLMALVLGTDDHYFAVSFDDFALVAHRLY